MGLRVRSLAGLRGVLTLPGLPGLSTLALAGATSALCLSLSAGVSVGGTTAAFNAQTTNSAGAVASLYVQSPAQSSATSASGGRVDLSWSASPTAATRAVGYLVYRRPAGSGSYTRLTPSPITALTYADTPSSDGSYEYAVQATVSTFSSPDRVVSAVSDRTGPTVTTSTTAGGGAYASNTWTNRSVTVSFTCADALSGVATCPASVNRSAEGANQSVSGTATDTVGNSTAASFTRINIDLTGPTAAGSLAASPGSDAVTLTWSAATDALSGVGGYEVSYAAYIRVPGGVSYCEPYAYWGNPGASGTSETVSGLTTGSRYCFQVVSRDAASNSGPAATLTNVRAG